MNTIDISRQLWADIFHELVSHRQAADHGPWLVTHGHHRDLGNIIAIDDPMEGDTIRVITENSIAAIDPHFMLAEAE